MISACESSHVQPATEQTCNLTTGHDLGQAERVVVAASAGATSALVSSPAELIMIQQQRTGGSLSGEARRMVATYGLRGLYRGFVSSLLQHQIIHTCVNST